MNTLGELGEFGLIARLARDTGGGEGVDVGIGDDCAVLRLGDHRILVSCDASLERVHFDRVYLSPGEIGWRAGASALSDIAAMGGIPRFVLVALACPPDTAADFAEAVYRGIREAVTATGAAIVGGDTTRAPEGICIDVTVIGEPAGDRILLRRGAVDGDLLVTTGYPGTAAAGLIALRSGHGDSECCTAHRHPVPRVQEGQWLAEQSAVHALIDLSDGLAADAGHLAEAAGLGVDIDPGALPCAPTLARPADGLGCDPVQLALSGGEDYELVFALAPEEADRVIGAFRSAFDLPVTPVGVFSGGHPGVTLDGEPFRGGGFDHFGTADERT